MASKLTTIKQYYKRSIFDKNKIKNFINKIFINDSFLPIGINYKVSIEGKNKSKSNFNSRCVLSGRSRANLNKFKMSRMTFKKYSEFGLINGIRKANW